MPPGSVNTGPGGTPRVEAPRNREGRQRVMPAKLLQLKT